MRDRPERILRIICLGLATLAAGQLIHAVFQANSLSHVKMPAVPALSADESSGGKTPNDPANSAPMMAGTNVTLARLSTNTMMILPTNVIVSATNLVVTNKVMAATGTNISTMRLAVESGANNVVSVTATNAATNIIVTASPARAEIHSISANPNSTSSETKAPLFVGTNNPQVAAGTNSAPAPGVAANPRPAPSGPGMAMMGMNGGPMPMMAGKPVSLPPEIKARVDKIVDSELFAPVMRPMPMALMGIAGDVAFLRSASGQTGLVKEGDSLGDLKLLRIGVNRVLVELNGQKKELTMFDGYGGESLLSKPNESSQ